MTRDIGMKTSHAWYINHSMCKLQSVWNVDVVLCHCMCILGGE